MPSENTEFDEIILDFELNLASIRGTDELYTYFDHEWLWLERYVGVNYKYQISVPKILARNKAELGQTEKRLSELTSKDLVLWFFHVFPPEYFGLIRNTLNLQFDARDPKFYQYTRVQLGRSWNELEHTRQYLCLYCQLPQFFPLTGKENIFTHWAYLHPLELPSFVHDIINDLAISVRPASDIVNNKGSRMHSADPVNGGHKFSKLVFEPAKSDSVMKLADVSERDVTYWYSRNIKCSTDNFLFYRLNPDFDAKVPRTFQYSLLYCDFFDGAETSRKLLCPYCANPTYLAVKGKYNFSRHMIGEHNFRDYGALMDIYREYQFEKRFTDLQDIFPEDEDT